MLFGPGQYPSALAGQFFDYCAFPLGIEKITAMDVLKGDVFEKLAFEYPGAVVNYYDDLHDSATFRRLMQNLTIADDAGKILHTLAGMSVMDGVQIPAESLNDVLDMIAKSAAGGLHDGTIWRDDKRRLMYGNLVLSADDPIGTLFKLGDACRRHGVLQTRGYGIIKYVNTNIAPYYGTLKKNELFSVGIKNGPVAIMGEPFYDEIVPLDFLVVTWPDLRETNESALADWLGEFWLTHHIKSLGKQPYTKLVARGHAPMSDDDIERFIGGKPEELQRALSLNLYLTLDGVCDMIKERYKFPVAKQTLCRHIRYVCNTHPGAANTWETGAIYALQNSDRTYHPLVAEILDEWEKPSIF